MFLVAILNAAFSDSRSSFSLSAPTTTLMLEGPYVFEAIAPILGRLDDDFALTAVEGLGLCLEPAAQMGPEAEAEGEASDFIGPTSNFIRKVRGSECSCFLRTP